LRESTYGISVTVPAEKSEKFSIPDRTVLTLEENDYSPTTSEKGCPETVAPSLRASFRAGGPAREGH